ncbi:MAG: FtsX-like permease family protein [Bacteroidota bacterium]
MLHFLKLTLRNFLRHRSSSIINLVGLTTGLTCAFFIYLWVQDEYAVDKFHEKDDRLYQVMGLQTFAEEKSVSRGTPGLLGESLPVDFPDIQYATTTTWINPALLSYDNTVLREDGYHVGQDFFNMFSYPLIMGDPNSALQDPSSICISIDLAKKLFGNVDRAMGQTIRYEDVRNFTVTGVFENINPRSTYRFDFVLPLQDFLDRFAWANEWGNTGPLTYVVLQEGVNWEATSEKIAAYVKTKAPESNVELFLKKYSDQYLQGRYANGLPDGGRIDYVHLFSAIAIFIMVIACINFMNLSTARASQRAQEVGIRKAIGAGRGGLIRQYIGEAVFVSFAAMLLSYLLITGLISPFNEITGKSISLSFTPQLITISIITVLLTGILAGSYPAFYLSHFRPIQVLRNEIKTSIGEVWARQGLVIFQFIITIVLLIGVVVIHRQTQYLTEKHLGYDRDNVIFFTQDGGIWERSATFLTELRKLPGVVHAGSTSHSLVGRVSGNPGLDWEGKTPGERVLFERFFVDYEFYETMGFQLAEGRWFGRSFGADSAKLLINEAAASAMGFSTSEVIGKPIKFGEDFQLEVIGVLKDFHYQSLHAPVGPAYFRLTSSGAGYVVARLGAGKEAAALQGIQALYEEFAPGYIFNYTFLDENYQALYASEERVGTLSTYFAGFAIIISCLGIFGLAAFTAERRIKEIGIRKVLGATRSDIVAMLSKDFILLVLVAIIIALPIAYLFMQEWLAQFAYPVDLSGWIFVIASVTALIIASLTVSSQAWKAASVNPAKCLKSE